MGENKMNKKIITKKSVAILGVLLVTITVYLYYNSSITYFGIVEIRELEHHTDESKITFEGDFGVRTSSFKNDDYFIIFKDEKPSEGNIGDIWKYLSEEESFHVLLKAYNNRNQFDLEAIYLD